MHANLFRGRVVEDESPDAIALLVYTPCSERPYLSGDDGLHGDTATEEHIDALIEEKHRGSIAFFRIHADVGLWHAGGDLPVDTADIVAGDVCAKLFEVESAATNPGCAAAEQQAVNRLRVKQGIASRLELKRDQRIEFCVGSHICWALCNRYELKNLVENLVCFDTFGLRVVAQKNAMTKRIVHDCLYIIRTNELASS